MHRLIRLIALSACVCSCAAQHHPPSLSRREGTVVAPKLLRGDLAVYWLRPDEVRGDPPEPKGFEALRRLIGRVQTLPHVEIGRVAYTLAAPKDALVFALFDPHGQTVNALLDGASDGDWVGLGRPGETELRLHPVPPKTQQAGCSGPRNELLFVDAPEVAGTVGNDTKRRLCVHLPADYATSQRRYPVVYVLPGFSGEEASGSILTTFRAADEAPTENAAIFVGVNIMTKAGASYLGANPTHGDFETFVARTLPDHIDRAYRTTARRAIMGQSTGGFGAVSLALRHSDRFGVVAASAPDGLDFGSWFLQPDGKHLVPLAADLLRLERAFGPPGQIASYAAEWSPDPAATYGLSWPAGSDGVVIPEVWARWQAHSPSALVQQPAILAAVRQNLSGKIYLTAGTADEFGLYAPTQRFSAELDALGIAHQLVTDGDGHSGSFARRQRLVAFVLERLK